MAVVVVFILVGEGFDAEVVPVLVRFVFVMDGVGRYMYVAVLLLRC